MTMILTRIQKGIRHQTKNILSDADRANAKKPSSNEGGFFVVV